MFVCRITGHLGSGYFGRVERGIWKKGDKDIEVALKILNKTDAQDKVKFLQETTLMAQFKHPNIINMLGVASKHQPVCKLFTLNYSMCLTMILI